MRIHINFKIFEIKVGDWVKGSPRTINNIKLHLSRLRLRRQKLIQKGKKGNVKPADFFNCILDPINIMPTTNYGAGDSPILGGHPPEPLHDVLLGSPNDTFKILDRLCPDEMKDFKQAHNLKMSEGNLKLCYILENFHNCFDLS